MKLNTLHPAEGAKQSRKRVGRGLGSGLGKTAGRGHKGQKSRSGGFHKTGFEGGQMPLQRRLPKFGFSSRIANKTAQVRLQDLNRVDAEIINLESLIEAGVVKHNMTAVKVFASGEINKAVVLESVKVSAGAKVAIEKAGGKVQ